MPTTYTHDLFGKQVYRKLPEEIRQIIRQNGNLYRIGLHGPDILFYYFISKNPVTQFGVDMHREKARAFFEQGMQRVRETENNRLLAYLLGFGCHYLLDSTCHPFVNEMEEAGVISHSVLEKEMDRTLMLETGKDPYSYRPSDCIVPKYSYAATIHKAMPLVKTVNIYMSLKMMKAFTNLLICNDGGKRREFWGRVASAFGKKRSLELMEFFMMKDPCPGSEVPVARLKGLYKKALLEAPQELCQLYELSLKEGHLSTRWDRNYNG